MIVKVTSFLKSGKFQTILPSNQIDSLVNLREKQAKKAKIFQCFQVKLHRFYFKLT